MYILIGGNAYGAGLITRLAVRATSESLKEINKEYAKYYDECNGVLLVIDHSGKEINLIDELRITHS